MSSTYMVSYSISFQKSDVELRQLMLQVPAGQKFPEAAKASSLVVEFQVYPDEAQLLQGMVDSIAEALRKVVIKAGSPLDLCKELTEILDAIFDDDRPRRFVGKFTDNLSPIIYAHTAEPEAVEAVGEAFNQEEDGFFSGVAPGEGGEDADRLRETRDRPEAASVEAESVNPGVTPGDMETMPDR